MPLGITHTSSDKVRVSSLLHTSCFFIVLISFSIATFLLSQSRYQTLIELTPCTCPNTCGVRIPTEAWQYSLGFCWKRDDPSCKLVRKDYFRQSNIASSTAGRTARRDH